MLRILALLTCVILSILSSPSGHTQSPWLNPKPKQITPAPLPTLIPDPPRATLTCQSGKVGVCTVPESQLNQWGCVSAHSWQSAIAFPIVSAKVTSLFTNLGASKINSLMAAMVVFTEKLNQLTSKNLCWSKTLTATVRSGQIELLVDTNPLQGYYIPRRIIFNFK